ncbi:hypothetical protein LEP1GSC112_0561, partial [Leptospira interrogans serovar Pomona str. UT364]
MSNPDSEKSWNLNFTIHSLNVGTTTKLRFVHK